MNKTNTEIKSGPCQEIAPGVYFLEVGGGFSRSNVYFVQSGTSWVLIDAASEKCGQLIRRAAESVFGAGTRPVAILLTHDHPDHAGSARELAQMWDCPVYVHPDELPLATIGDMATVKKYASPLDRWIVLPILHLMPRRRAEAVIAKSSLKGVVQALDPDASIPGLPDWKCISAPGHTPGHIAFFRSSDCILVTGDAILTVDLNSICGVLSWIFHSKGQRVSGPPWYSTWRKQTAKKSVMELAGLEPHVLAPGHGLPMTGERMARDLRTLADRFTS